jgi:hypothetical protein
MRTGRGAPSSEGGDARRGGRSSSSPRGAAPPLDASNRPQPRRRSS